MTWSDQSHHEKHRICKKKNVIDGSVVMQELIAYYSRDLEDKFFVIFSISTKHHLLCMSLFN